jgi:ribosomal protein S18 acetylase RimI-like enzyme
VPADICHIRPATVDDVKAIVRIHRAAFPNFYLTDLGPAFLRAYYGLVLDYDAGCLLAADVESSLAGFVAGFRDPPRFYRAMQARKWRLAAPVALGVLRRPWLVMRTLRNTLRVRSLEQEPSANDATCCELSSIAVAPGCAGRGVGQQLVASFVESSGRLGAAMVYLNTDAVNNEAVNGFYKRAGFRVARTYEASGGRLMHEYVLSLDRKPAAAAPNGGNREATTQS